MSTNARTPEKGNGTEQDPIDSPDSYEYRTEPGREIWEHTETGLRVIISKKARPSQMHTPETARRMEGYEAMVRGPDDVGEPISANDLGNREGQLENAEEFMAAFPDGEYETEVPDNPWKYGTVRWRDEVQEGDA